MWTTMRRLVVASVIVMAGATTLQVVPAPAGSPVPTAAAAAAAEPALLAPLPGWRPWLGPVFNEPGRKGSRAILGRVLRAIRHTPRGETIRIATYSLDRTDIAHALRRARKRGVFVQVVVNSHSASGVVWSLRRSLGKNPRRNSFVVVCSGRCRARGDGGNQHLKVFSFSRAGGTRDLIIGSSGNLTSKAVYRQWNDSWAIAYDPKVYDAWVGFFNQMRFQRQRGPRVVQSHQGQVANPYSIWLQRTADGGSPTLARSASQDPVVRRLRDIGCRTGGSYGNGKGRTVVRIMEYAVFGARGRMVADAIADVKRRGCDVMVIGSVFSRPTISIIRRAGVPIRMADWRFADRNPAEEDGLGGWGPRFYGHFKAMFVSGQYQRKATRSVWTGSENWSGISFANEEIVVRFTDPAYYRAYARQFTKMWRGRATHRAGIEPTYGPRG